MLLILGQEIISQILIKWNMPTTPLYPFLMLWILLHHFGPFHIRLDWFTDLFINNFIKQLISVLFFKYSFWVLDCLLTQNLLMLVDRFSRLLSVGINVQVHIPSVPLVAELYCVLLGFYDGFCLLLLNHWWLLGDLLQTAIHAIDAFYWTLGKGIWYQVGVWQKLMLHAVHMGSREQY